MGLPGRGRDPSYVEEKHGLRPGSLSGTKYYNWGKEAPRMAAQQRAESAAEGARVASQWKAHNAELKRRQEQAVWNEYNANPQQIQAKSMGGSFSGTRRQRASGHYRNMMHGLSTTLKERLGA